MLLNLKAAAPVTSEKLEDLKVAALAHTQLTARNA